jgi:alanyl-tRNA synthetase
VRRIEAVTGEGAVEYVEQTDDLLRGVSALVRATREDVAQRVQENLEQIRALERQVRSLQDRLASGQGTDLAGSAVDVGGIKVVATQLIGADATALRNAVDQLKAKLQSAVVVLASIGEGERITLVAGVTPDLTSRLKAGEIISAVATQVGGKGGGRPDFAQAGGTDVSALGSALASVLPWVRSRLS